MECDRSGYRHARDALLQARGSGVREPSGRRDVKRSPEAGRVETGLPGGGSSLWVHLGSFHIVAESVFCVRF